MVWVVGKWSSYLIASSFPRKCENIRVGRSQTGLGKKICNSYLETSPGSAHYRFAAMNLN